MSGTDPLAAPLEHALARSRPVRDKDDLVRNAFRRRAEHAVEQIARSATLETLARALEAPTDFGAVAWALGNSAIPAPALGLDPLADALARGVGERERLAKLAGGLLSAEETGRALGGLSRQAVDKRRRSRQLLAVRVAGDWRYPAIQVGADGQAVPALPLILAAADGAGMSGWATLDFLLAPDDTLGGITPLDALRHGGGDAVRRLLDAAKADAFG